MHRYDKSFSTRGRGEGTLIDAPILAYLVETPSARLLIDVGCDYLKLSQPDVRARWFRPELGLGAPTMTDDQRIPRYLERLGLDIGDIDAVILTHLHFDHAGGLAELEHAEVHVHARELEAARAHADALYFEGETIPGSHWRTFQTGFELCPGVSIVETPGHTAGHVSVLVEQSRGALLLAGDAADLTENLSDEVAPGLCHNDDPTLAVASIRKLKEVARATGASLWPNHDITFFRSLPPFPASH
jgi:N-acyl homoserine lactone hydrolase